MTIEIKFTSDYTFDTPANGCAASITAAATHDFGGYPYTSGVTGLITCAVTGASTL